jgi:hypothetical protein
MLNLRFLVPDKKHVFTIVTVNLRAKMCVVKNIKIRTLLVIYVTNLMEFSLLSHLVKSATKVF